MASKAWIRWALLVPGLSAAAVALFALYFPLHFLLLRLCPANSRVVISTTDIQAENLTQSDVLCEADWFSSADRGLLIVMVLISMAGSAAIAYRIAPSSKVLVTCFIVLIWLFISVVTYASWG